MSVGISGKPVLPLQFKPTLVTPQAIDIEQLPRNERIDAVRVFAAAGIVYTHAAESREAIFYCNLFRFGVPFFLFASLYFQSRSLRRHHERTLGQFIEHRFRRLYLPFLVWSVVYLACRDFERIVLHHLSAVDLRYSMLWTGTEYHLWFLPFLLVCSIMLGIVDRSRLIQNRYARLLIIAVTLIGGAFCSHQNVPVMPTASHMTFDDPRHTYFQWALAAPAAFWAFAFALATTTGPMVLSVSPMLGASGILLLIVCSVVQMQHGLALTPRALSGLGAMLAAMAPWKSKLVQVFARLGRKGYGIYLCHVIPVEIVHQITHRMHFNACIPLDMATFAIGFSGACAIVFLLERSARFSWLIG